MDVKVKNRKTGQIKMLPQKVADNLSHIWKIEGESEPAIEPVSKKKEELNENVLPVGNDLSEEYTKLSGGKKPDGRWSAEKLESKVNELKNTLIVNTDESK